ncbi:hypothetical protein ACVW00_004287 [Marmoricola sp. URHA0025 HA25]
MRLVRSALVVAAAAAVALAPATALADGASHTDTTGDVQSVPITGSANVPVGTPATPEPTVSNGDITSVRATNSARKVKVVLHFADLHTSGEYQVHEAYIATKGADRVAVVTAGPGNWAGKANLFTPKFKKVRCSVRRHIDYTRHTVVLKVPSSCLGHPKVIKVGAATVINEAGKFFYDDGYKTLGGFRDSFALSPKIHR